jgi:diadenosine tetraphosphate (Ap4A) HIT family hydrolase
MSGFMVAHTSELRSPRGANGTAGHNPTVWSQSGLTMANATETKFGDPGARLAQTDCWTVLLRPRQPTLGSLVLICREPVLALADVSPQGYAELRAVVRRIETVLREVVAYERINYLMLMMVDPDVHFHVIPRYAGTRHIGLAEFPDVGWPGPPALDAAVAPDVATNEALLARLREAWRRGAG